MAVAVKRSRLRAASVEMADDLHRLGIIAKGQYRNST
jgi:hypothetical protein